MTSADLAGLTPEQVANVSRINLENEALRQESVANIFRAVGQTSQAEYMSAMAEKIRHPELQYIYDAAIERIKKAKTPDEINKLRADTYQSLQAGRLSEQRADEISRTLDEKEEALRLGNELKVAELDEYLSVLFPAAGGGTEEAAIKSADVARLMAAEARRKEDLGPEKWATQQEQQAVAIEETIRGKGKGQGPKSAAALAQYQDFNRYSNRPYVAVNVDGEVKFFKLPRVGGKIITARQVYEAAQKVNMDIGEYVAKVLGVPEVKEALGIYRTGAGGGF